MSNHARQVIRNVRRKLAKQLRQGQHTLRVKGIQEGGFVLGAMTGNGFVGFGRVYDKQNEAVRIGEKFTGQKAKKLLKAV